MITPFVVTPEVFRRFRQKELKTFLLPLPSVKAPDRFKEISIKKTHVRLYFNDYQLGFNFSLGRFVSLYGDAELAATQIYNTRPDAVDSLSVMRNIFKTPVDPSEFYYSVRDVNVVRRTELFQIINSPGYAEAEVDLLFPILGNCHWLLVIELDFTNLNT